MQKRPFHHYPAAMKYTPDATLRKVIARRLREVRIERRLTQVDVAKKLGVSKQLISQWEHDRSNITISHLIELAEMMQITPGSLLDELIND